MREGACGVHHPSPPSPPPSPAHHVLLGRHHLHQLVRKRFVGFHVRGPQVGVEAAGRGGGEGRQVVQERPQLLLAEAAVVPVLQVGAQEDGAAAVRGGEVEGDGVLFGRRHLGGEAPHEVDVRVFDALLRERGGGGGRGGRLLGASARGRPAASSLPAHRRLRDQGVLVPFKRPLARLGGTLHLEGEVVGDEDEAGGGARGAAREGRRGGGVARGLAAPPRGRLGPRPGRRAGSRRASGGTPPRDAGARPRRKRRRAGRRGRARRPRPPRAAGAPRASPVEHASIPHSRPYRCRRSPPPAESIDARDPRAASPRPTPDSGPPASRPSPSLASPTRARRLR